MSVLRLWWLPAAAMVAQSAAALPPARLREAEVKAVFLLNFTRFVEWPPDSFPGPGDPIVIGVLGADPFGKLLDEAVRGERVNGRPIVVRRFKNAQELEPCQVLYISSSEKERVPGILELLRDSKTLTVGESDRFASQGGAIRLMTEKNRVRFEINKGAADRAGLRISSQLLRLGRVVGGE